MLTDVQRMLNQRPLTQSVDGCPLMDTVPADARVAATSV